MIKKDEWVQISSIVLNAEERASQLPQDTAQTPLVMWVKGYLLEEAEIGDEVVIRTVTGREVTGTLVNVNPVFTHSFGKYVPEITQIHKILDEDMKGDTTIA